ncbi:MAG TPA: aminoacetone oxidase family FAD-binding enzyme [Candidatus Paceibacterota bacterium]|nr:aminoacetone oxidase family FAD-binding enzyme [Candidatus Paceibacterota bacterium]
MSTSREYDVVVVGGGPAGMMAAGRAGERGLRVLLIEKNEVLGKKLSITGGGRCNVTNAEDDIRTLLRHYGDAEQFLYSPFSRFGVRDTFAFIEAHGVPLVVEERKRAFPKTHKAPDVTRAMERYVADGKVTVLLKTAVQGFETTDGRIAGVVTDRGTFVGRAYVIASGGKSHAETGSSGESISWLRAVGHTAHEPNPNLVPLVVEDAWVKRLAGTVLRGARIAFNGATDKLVKDGDILMTHFGLSGPTILNAAHEVKELLSRGAVNAEIDLFPHEDEGALRTRLNELLQVHSNKNLQNALRAWFPNALAETLIGSAENARLKAHSVGRELRGELTLRMKRMPITVTGTMGYDWAIVSDGGVDLSEIDTRTMRSKLHENLYLVGDVLNINRPSGGFSLQLCWTTGWLAGESACATE